MFLTSALSVLIAAGPMAGTSIPSASIAPADAARVECNARENRYCAEIQRLMRDARVKRALQFLERNDSLTTRDLYTLTEIEAPPFKEAVRGQKFAQMLREAGADSVWTDPEGNVIGLRRGTKRERSVVIEGHLDTVFPEGTDVKIKVRGDTLMAPGIADDTRGVVATLAALRAMSHADLRTEADVLFMGTVGEEGLGDLRGVKYLFREGAPKIDAYISVEPGENGVTIGGIGSHRYRVTFKGPGGHSWGAFGTANPIHALGRAIRLFDEQADQLTKSGPRTSYNVGRIGGGTSVNSVAFEAWMEVDMRSEDDASLEKLDQALKAAIQQALSEQNAVARRGEHLTVDVQMVGDRPSGSTDRNNPLIQRIGAIIGHLGGTPRFGSGSTNSNIPFSRGVPAVTIGAGGQSGDAHALTEWWADTRGDAHRSIQQALLLVLAEGVLSK